MTEYRIRDYRPSDQQDLARFFQEVLGELGFDYDPGTKDRDLDRVPDVYQSDGGRFLLAERGGRVIGTIALRELDAGTGELKRFYVLREDRRRVVGSDLLDRLLAHARAGRWASVRLDTSHRSPAAISLFEKRGFVEIPRYNDDLFADIFMELSVRRAFPAKLRPRSRRPRLPAFMAPRFFTTCRPSRTLRPRYACRVVTRGPHASVRTLADLDRGCGLPDATRRCRGLDVNLIPVSSAAVTRSQPFGPNAPHE